MTKAPFINFQLLPIIVHRFVLFVRCTRTFFMCTYYAPSARLSALRLQFEAIKDFLNSGGSAAFLLGEGGEDRLGTNVNYLLEEYGMTVHKDSVVRGRVTWLCDD